jgi:hypothetical protein
MIMQTSQINNNNLGVITPVSLKKSASNEFNGSSLKILEQDNYLPKQEVIPDNISKKNLIEDTFNHKFYMLCKEENKRYAADTLAKMLENESYSQSFSWLTEWVSLEFNSLERSIHTTNYPLVISAIYDNIPMFKLIIQYLLPKNISHKLQKRFLCMNHDVNRDIVDSFKAAIMANNTIMAEYIYMNFANIINPNCDLFIVFFRETLICTKNPEAFMFLYTKLISAAEGDKLFINCINDIAREAVDKWKLKGNQKMLDYIKISDKINFLANDLG